MPDPSLTFVGREREMELLGGAVEEACGGAGALWLVSGEPGIGKSRLAEEVASTGRDRGMRVLWGRCWEAGGAPAYWPWVQVLRALLRTAPLDQYDTHASELAQILPELGDAAAHEEAGLEAEQSRFRLMDAVASMLSESTKQLPVLIIIEDLHAADESTVMLLDFLSTFVRNQSLLVLATFRESEAKKGAAASALARALRNGSHLALGRLEPDAVVRFASGGETPLGRDRARTLHETTDGHPLFMVEVARLWRAQAAQSGAATVPATVRATIEERLEKLHASTRRALQHASVIGREFESSLLETGYDEAPSISEALEEATGAAMVEEVGLGRFRFSHFLVREVLYESIEAEARAEAHRGIARVLLRDEHAQNDALKWSEVAHHLKAVGPAAASEAADAYRRVGHHAMRQLAFEDAIHAFQEASTCHRATSAGDPKEEIELMIDLGRAQISAGHVADGKEACLHAARLARTRKDPELFARAALERGSALIFAQIDDKLVDLLEEALALLADSDSALRARVLARLAAAQQPALDPSGPFEIARQAVEMARRVGDDETLLDTFRDGGSALVDLEDAEKRLPFDTEHATLAEALGNRVEVFRATARKVFDLAELARVQEAYRAMDRCSEIARDLGHAAFEWRAVAMTAARALWQGEIAEAEDLVEEAGTLGLHSGDPNSFPVYAVQKLRLLRLAGDYDAQAAVIADLERRWQEWGIGGALVNAILGSEHVIAGRSELGVRRYEPGSVETALRVRDRTMQIALSRICIAADDRAAAQALYEGASRFDGSIVTGGALFMTFDEPMSAALARLAAFLGKADEADEHHERAVSQARGTGGRPVADAIEAEHASRARTPRPTDSPTQSGITMEETGESWIVRGGRVTFHLKNTKGVRMLAQLVAEPGREFHVLELSGGKETPEQVIDRGDAGEMIDEDARRAYRQRAEQLRREIEQAEEWNDAGRLERAQEELEFLTRELARAVGLGGRERRAGGASERARVNVQRRIRDALRRVKAQDPDLAKRLDKDVRTGTFCAYEPT